MQNLRAVVSSVRTAFSSLNGPSKAVAVGLLFIATLAITWRVSLVPAEITEPAINPGADRITTWPAGPLVGIAPLAVGADVDLDGCTTMATNATVDLVPHEETSAFWIFADDSAQIRLVWTTDEVEQSFLIPEQQLASEAIPGRITVTLAARSDGATASVSVPQGTAELCGVQANAGPDGGPLAESGLITSWPAGPLSGIAPTALDQTVDTDGCVSLEESATLTTSPDLETSTVWVFADPSTKVLLEWRTTSLDQAYVIPETILANDNSQGRATVTFAPRDNAPSTVAITAATGAARICGLQGS